MWLAPGYWQDQRHTSTRPEGFCSLKGRTFGSFFFLKSCLTWVVELQSQAKCVHWDCCLWGQFKCIAQEQFGKNTLHQNRQAPLKVLQEIQFFLKRHAMHSKGRKICRVRGWSSIGKWFYAHVYIRFGVHTDYPSIWSHFWAGFFWSEGTGVQRTPF